jgi:hypothetical protein
MTIASGGAVTFSQVPVYHNNTVETADIQDNAITLAKLAGGTDGNIISFDASGDPVAIATGSDGQVLTSTGAGSPPAFETLPGGGIENITTFRMTTSFTLATSAQITANWSASGASLGTAISESSGTFSFPQTGLYRVEANFYMHRLNGGSAYIGIVLKHTTNNSSYGDFVQNYGNIHDLTNEHGLVYAAGIVDVTNTSNDKVQIHYEAASGNNIRLVGNSSHDRTYIRFIRLGDT